MGIGEMDGGCERRQGEGITCERVAAALTSWLGRRRQASGAELRRDARGKQQQTAAMQRLTSPNATPRRKVPGLCVVP